MRGENMLTVLSNRHNFSPFYKKSWSLNTMVRAVFRPEADLTLFLRVHTKDEIAKT